MNVILPCAQRICALPKWSIHLSFSLRNSQIDNFREHIWRVEGINLNLKLWEGKWNFLCVQTGFYQLNGIDCSTSGVYTYKQEGYGPIDFPALVSPGHIWSQLVTPGHTCPVWSHLSHLVTFGNSWSHLSHLVTLVPSGHPCYTWSLLVTPVPSGHS